MPENKNTQEKQNKPSQQSGAVQNGGTGNSQPRRRPRRKPGNNAPTANGNAAAQNTAAKQPAQPAHQPHQAQKNQPGSGKQAKNNAGNNENRRTEQKPQNANHPHGNGRRGRRPGHAGEQNGKPVQNVIVAPAETVTVTDTPMLPQPQKKEKQGKNGAKVKIIPLGGIGEIGKNITVIEYENDIIIIDCGIAFPDDDMLGVDLVIPDFTYLEKNADRIRGLLLTHGHEDHIGAVPYLLRTLDVPVYGTRLTIGILEKKLSEHILPHTPRLNTVEPGDTVRLGVFTAEFIRVNHSIADACAIAVRTPLGVIVHSGDFKLDVTPMDGKMMDVARLGELGKQGVLMLLCESTNAERPGFTPSERKVGQSLENIFMRHTDKRIVIATFSSNVHRVQQIIDLSVRYGRKVAVSGRSMVNIVGAAVSLGYMKMPEGTLVDINDIKKYPPNQITLITTGSQGEPMSALYRMAFSDHERVTLGPQDLVIISATPIPGNEKLVGRVINELLAHGITVLHDSSVDVHVSGHACQEELKFMHALTNPKFFMPIHGEYRHLSSHRELALFMGMDPKNIFMPETGKVLELSRKGAEWNGTVPSGRVLVDGSGVGDVGNIVLRDRRHLAQDGLIVVVASIDMTQKEILSGPDIVSRGFVYMREAGDLMDGARAVAQKSLSAGLESDALDWMEIKTRVKDDLSRYLFQQTKRKPMILPIIMNV